MLKKEARFEEVLKKYNIDLKKLEEEQKKLAKNLEIKDKIDFSLVERIAGIENIFFRNRIISAIVVINGNFELVEQEYVDEKIKFPYIPGFRAYRELPSMMSAFDKLDEKPDVVFVRGHGIMHPRGLGIASHFSLASGIAGIGIADSLIIGEEKGGDIFMNGKLVGKIVKTKEGANPIYVSPGNLISVSSAVNLVKKFTNEPHKIPEPLRLARRYAKEVMKELYFGNKQAKF
jgi:deoxyribonuclease V